MGSYGVQRLCVLGACLALALAVVPTAHALGDEKDVPQYRVDASWPKRLPNNWIMGQVGGLSVDNHDHIWVLQRPLSATPDELGAQQTPVRSICCNSTPSVLEFDSQGNLIRAWGGPGYVPDWPKSEHGIWVDRQGNVWIAGNAPADRQVLKFSADGKLLLEIGHSSQEPKDNQDTALLGQPAGVEVDDAAHEVYVADGYMNNRVVVFDSNTGEFKRGWGAYGIPLADIKNDPPYAFEGEQGPAALRYSPGKPLDPQFKNPVHCARLSADGYVYVCDRANDRVQVFTRMGAFVQEFLIHPTTLGNGSVWAISFSHDPKQKYLLIADGEDNVVWIVRRDDGTVVSSFGHNGRNAGDFHWLHQAALDSHGNYYTGEVDSGKRIQKFVLQKGH
jgi:DNA-binding beta-propeller fold protein YncE